MQSRLLKYVLGLRPLVYVLGVCLFLCVGERLALSHFGGANPDVTSISELISIEKGKTTKSWIPGTNHPKKHHYIARRRFSPQFILKKAADISFEPTFEGVSLLSVPIHHTLSTFLRPAYYTLLFLFALF